MTNARVEGRPLIASYVNRLKAIFKSAATKHEAHSESARVMQEMAADEPFFSAVLAKHLGTPGALNATHYPVPGFEIESNPYFELVANAWIPLPSGETDVSTKAIHHHGELLLTTATAFGPGYEHWMLTRPREVDGGRHLYAMDLIDHGRHGLHEVAFVDAYVAHLPLYPPSLTVTLCLWSHRGEKTWRDSLKRVPIVQRNADSLRRVVTRLGLGGQLEIKEAEFFDFYPTADGFVGMEHREEFPRGPNSDYLHTLFHILQETGNARLADLVQEQVERAKVDDVTLARRLLADLEAGTPIEGRLSEGHYGVPHANFTREAIEQALAARTAIEH